MLSYRLVLYYDICIVSLKYFFAYGTLNLIFFYITLHYNGSVTCTFVRQEIS